MKEDTEKIKKTTVRKHIVLPQKLYAHKQTCGFICEQ